MTTNRRGSKKFRPKGSHTRCFTERVLKLGYKTERVRLLAAVDGLIALSGTIDRKGDASATLSAHP